MSFFLGTRGALAEIRCPSTIEIEPTAVAQEVVTIGGRRRVQLPAAGHGLRKWKAASNLLGHLDRLLLEQYAAQTAPLMYVDHWMQLTNVLLPQQARLEPVFTSSRELTRGVPLRADGALVLGARGPADQYVQITPTWQPPVVPGQVLTFAAYVTGDAILRIIFTDAAGNIVKQINTPATTFTQLTRHSWTGIVPAGAVSVDVAVGAVTELAAPTLTWTDEVRPVAVGAGVESVVVTPPSTSVVMATKEVTLAAGGYEFWEVSS